MAEGKLDREINISSKDELQDLANNFNLMARTLREKLMDLENRVSKEQRMVRELAILSEFISYASGDEVLKTIAKIIRGNTRKVDFPARYGGEEFVIILPESDCEHARVIAERIRTAVMEYPFYVKDGSRVQLTVSIGISCFPKDATILTPI